VITAIHGVDGKIGHRSKSGHKSIWRDIVQDMEVVKNQGADLFSFMQKKLGNGADTCFWEDTWRGDMPFKQGYSRLYALELDKNINVAAKFAQTSLMEEVALGDMMDRWYWSLEGSGDFSVASVRKLIDDIRLPGVPSQTRWIKAVPINVNVLAWKVRLDGLPSRLNISRRGMDITSILCPICDREVESVSHVFFACHVAKDNFQKICRWWNVDFMEVRSYDDWLLWMTNLRIHGKHKKVLEGVCYRLWWHLWSFRNKCVFGSDIPPKERLFDDVVRLASFFNKIVIQKKSSEMLLQEAFEIGAVKQYSNAC
ncbi:RNA-directed DNA polymerase, eukaryota, reverse transcriptase zinc-binding domain protein, partial [Tanacetum coccineum]